MDHNKKMHTSTKLWIAGLLCTLCTGCQGGVLTGPDKDPTQDPLLREQARRAEELQNSPPSEIPENLTLPPPESNKSTEPDEPIENENDMGLQDYAKAVSFEQPVTFSGPASGEQHFCLTDCDICQTSGEITIVFLPNGTTKLGYHTGCYVFGMNGCEKSFDCLYEITGGYSRMMEVMSFATCSGSSTVHGSGTVNDESTSGSVTCSSNGEINTIITWDKLKRVSS